MIKGASDGSERATIADLAERLQLAGSTTSELVKRAEEAAVIECKRWPMDRRVVHVYLTREGERRLARAFRSLGDERRKLREIIAALDEQPGSRTS